MSIPVESFTAFIRGLQELFAKLDELDEPHRSDVFELLDAIDTLHRTAFERIVSSVDAATLARLRQHPEVAWLLDAYGFGTEPAQDTVFVQIKPRRR